MSLLAESLTIWEIAFRWAGYNPRKIWLHIPLEVQDHLRNLMDAILKAELSCETITLEKRKFGPDEPQEASIYHWLDDIYACIGGHHFNRKMLRWALLSRYDLKQWCERWNIPLPEFWFPPGWNLEYDLAEDELLPGHGFYRRDWTTEDWARWREEREASEQPTPATENTSPQDETGEMTKESEPSVSNEPTESSEPPTPNEPPASEEQGASDKLRPAQRARIACQQIASSLWKQFPDMTITAMVAHDAVQNLGGGAFFVQEVVHRWLSDVAPEGIKGKRGRPKKK